MMTAKENEKQAKAEKIIKKRTLRMLKKEKGGDKDEENKTLYDTKKSERKDWQRKRKKRKIVGSENCKVKE